MGTFGPFEWDDVKNAANQTKHGLPLLAAAALFDDPDHVEMES
jgi:uncharacterized DUF497 family protein